MTDRPVSLRIFPAQDVNEMQTGGDVRGGLFSNLSDHLPVVGLDVDVLKKREPDRQDIL
jgi:hypothetical protein